MNFNISFVSPCCGEQFHFPTSQVEGSTQKLTLFFKENVQITSFTGILGFLLSFNQITPLIPEGLGLPADSVPPPQQHRTVTGNSIFMDVSCAKIGKNLGF